VRDDGEQVREDGEQSRRHHDPPEPLALAADVLRV
jgi:hypothetical protein